jgi:hypothetical protein
MLMNPVGLKSEKCCAGDARQKLKSTDPTSRQRPHISKPETVNKKLRMGKTGHKSQVDA